MNRCFSDIHALNVLPEFLDIFLADLLVGQAFLVCTLDNFIVNIRKILNKSYVIADILKEAAKNVKNAKRPCVADMDKIVNSRAAGVNLNLALLNRFKLFLASCESVENLHLFVLQFLFKLFNFALQSAKLLGDRIGNVNLVKILNPFAVPANDSCRNADSR